MTTPLMIHEEAFWEIHRYRIRRNPTLGPQLMAETVGTKDCTRTLSLSRGLRVVRPRLEEFSSRVAMDLKL